MARVLVFMVCVLMLGAPANAGITPITDKMDYTHNYNEWLHPLEDPDRVVFVRPWGRTIDNTDPHDPDIIDHMPWYRNNSQSWGWTHDVSGRVPADAIGVDSATLVIEAWDVNVDEDPDNPDFRDQINEIYLNNILVGRLEFTPTYEWGTTIFTLSRPTHAAILDDLWQDGQIYVYMNIDALRPLYGRRSTLGSSMLTVYYDVTGPGRDPVQPIFRFWSPTLSCHFYTTIESERDGVIQHYSSTWSDYEGPVYYLPIDDSDPDVRPIYRFWSSTLSSHFYTIDPGERDHILTTYPTEIWQLEGVVFYAYPDGLQPADARPVYRFWSGQHGTHFYTISEDEKDFVIATYPSYTWAYEGVVWYAFDK